MTRLLPLSGVAGAAGPAAAAWLAGGKAARLARAANAGLPVLPGWIVPATEARLALAAGVAEVNAGRPAAARRSVLGCRLDDELAAELRDAVNGLGGRVIVRSSSPLESDPRWSGAFSSVAEVGEQDVARAVRSCWASAFAVDPLARLAACGLPPEALELGVLVQPELEPVAGGVATVTAGGRTGHRVTVEGVRGHPGPLLAGWAEGASAQAPLCAGARQAPRPADAGFCDQGLTGLLGIDMVTAVAALADQVWHTVGDDVIEWAADDGGLWLLQCLRSAPTGVGATRAGAGAPGGNQALAPLSSASGGRRPALADLLGARTWMPLLAATVRDRGEHVWGRPAAPGTAAGRLLACRPHERPPGDCSDAILLVDRPLPALAPLLFSARGVIARTGGAGSHLAEVARSLGVPMVTGCRIPGPTHAARAWLAAVDGATGAVALLPDTDEVMRSWR